MWVGAMLWVLPCEPLYVVSWLSFPRFMSATGFSLWFSVLAGGCGGLGEVHWWGGCAWGGLWRVGGRLAVVVQ